MSRIILDFGSGNTCKNQKSYIRKMYDELKRIDRNKHEIIVKWQLFNRAGINISLKQEMFNFAYEYGNELGYKVTASVFDKESLDFLLLHDIPFVKIANNRMLDYLIPSIPENIQLYISGNTPLWLPERKKNVTQLWCISDYPANKDDYMKMKLSLGCAISDHTTDFYLFRTLMPRIIEWHYKLGNSTGLDSGDFARTPEQLKEIL